MVVLKVGLSCESPVLCTSGKNLSVVVLFILKFHTIYILPCTYQKKKVRKVELHPSYQNLVATLDLVSRPRTSSLTLRIALLRLCTRILALTLMF
jgi:hypothetical protein